MASDWKFRQEICDIGRRLYARGYAAGNDGNISYRLTDSTVLCTPTQICKGFMEPDDLCIVNMQGEQLSGQRKRTSEVLMHLEIYRGDPAVKAVVHCHPPHATAFGVARIDIPSCILPEVEVFLGLVPRAEYETPGGPDFAATIRPHIGKANTVILSNHGTVSWGPTVERAYWHTEILDSYCRILLLAQQLGHVERLPDHKVEDLMALREKFGGGVDPRRRQPCEICVNRQFGCPDCPTPATSAAATAAAASSAAPAPAAPRAPGDTEALVRAITARVLESLGQR